MLMGVTLIEVVNKYNHREKKVRRNSATRTLFEVPKDSDEVI